MKVLWFTNTACSAAEKLGIKSHRGGWLKSLEDELSLLEEVDLSICFYAAGTYDPFKVSRTAYYPVPRKNTASKAGRYFNRVFRKTPADNPEIKLLLSVIEQVKPDLIHIHGTEDNFGLIQQHVSVPIIVSIQGILSPYLEKYYAGIPRTEASRHESLAQKLSFKSASYLYEKLSLKAVREREMLKKTRYVIGRTDWDRRVTRVLSPGSIYYYNNEILRSSFYNANWNKDHFNAKLRIVTISSGAIFKGFETIVKTAKILASYPGFSFEWSVIGLDEKSTIVTTVNNWLKMNLTQLNIMLLGSLSEEKVVEVLCNADIYCQVSHIENSPNSLCEAMLIGMPVIATAAGGTSSLLQSEREGILCQDGDPYALGGSVIELSNDFLLAKKYGRNAREKAGQRHNKKQITADLLQVYAAVLNDNK